MTHKLTSAPPAKADASFDHRHSPFVRSYLAPGDLPIHRAVHKHDKKRRARLTVGNSRIFAYGIGCKGDAMDA